MLLKNEGRKKSRKKVEDWYRCKEMMNADSDKLISFMFAYSGSQKR
jgi:hypothetical protein